MPLWTVEGADKSTGKDVVRSIDAPTDVLARDTAVRMGILVADVHRSAADPLEELGAVVQAANSPPSPPLLRADAPTLNYSTVRTNPALPVDAINAPPLGSSGTPEYRDIVRMARWARVLSIFPAVVGGICMAMATAAFVLTLLSSIVGPAVFELGLTLGLPSVISTAGMGVVFGAIAVMLRLAASVALAVRDMARNTFRS